MTTTTVSQAVEKRDSGPVSLMFSRKRHFAAVLPASVDVEAFLGTAAGALYASDVPGKNLTLMKCAQANPDSLIVALMECAALGHMPGTDEYYLTPRMDHGRPKILGIEGYRGVIERMYRSGAVNRVVVREVCAYDPFDYVEGRDRVPIHEVGGRGGTGAAFFGEHGSRNRGEMIGVYAYAELLTGSISRIVLLTRDDVFAARDSGGYKPDDQYSPWNRLDGGPDHPEFTGRSMWWKTGAKRLEPWVPTSREYRREMLRASAAAAEQAQVRPDLAAPPAALTGVPQDIVDADIVDPPQDPGPAAPDPEPPSARTSSAAPAGPAAGPGATPAVKQAVEKLADLLRQVPLGDESDVAAFVTWVTGQPAGHEITAADARKLAAVLDNALRKAGGDGEKAAAALWDQQRKDVETPGGGG